MNKNKSDQLLEKIIKRLDNIEKTMATKQDIKNIVTKQDIKKLENRIIKKLNFVIGHFDSESIEIKQKLDKVEKRVDLFAPA